LGLDARRAEIGIYFTNIGYHIDMTRNMRCAGALLMCILALASGGCAWIRALREPHNPLATWVPSKNHNARGALVIVVHATEQDSVQASLDTLRSANAHGRVSAHYLVGRDGRIYQLVKEGRRAWHAGGGSWGNITDLNSASIGIELDNNGESDFPPTQVQSLLVLLEDLCTRLDIPRRQVIAHADLAPSRKTDPGARFPWRELADAGFGRWPTAQALEQAPPPGFDPWLAMRALGYRLDDRPSALRAFRLHFRGIDDAATPMSPEDERVLHALMQSP
jgi:N-acetylmuramoyl-L-alanine amidase